MRAFRLHARRCVRDDRETVINCTEKSNESNYNHAHPFVHRMVGSTAAETVELHTNMGDLIELDLTLASSRDLSEFTRGAEESCAPRPLCFAD